MSAELNPKQVCGCYPSHWALIPEEGSDPLTPQEVYVESRKTQIPKWQAWTKAARKKLDQMLTEAA